MTTMESPRAFMIIALIRPDICCPPAIPIMLPAMMAPLLTIVPIIVISLRSAR